MSEGINSRYMEMRMELKAPGAGLEGSPKGWLTSDN